MDLLSPILQDHTAQLIKKAEHTSTIEQAKGPVKAEKPARQSGPAFSFVMLNQFSSSPEHPPRSSSQQ
jgi:hypothetical protein